MHLINERNVNSAFPAGVSLAIRRGVKTAPRGLETLEVPVPVATVYQRPCERVLLDPVRDANPFFHFMEALWIIGGRNDVSFLTTFNKRMAEYSDNGETFHGAYGYRLRKQHGDQVFRAITKLQKEPNTRQVVLQIWDSDLDLGPVSKDIPCNDLIMLKIRDNKLMMTVCNRSNDIIWGCYGANVVQFSMLQEYLTAMIGCEIGMYTQYSDSFHIYTDIPNFEYYKTLCACNFVDPYEHGIQPYQIVEYPALFDSDLKHFLDLDFSWKYANSFFEEVAWPMWDAWVEHKHNCGAEEAIRIKADDWRLACLAWLERRKDSISKERWGFTNEQLVACGMA